MTRWRRTLFLSPKMRSRKAKGAAHGYLSSTVESGGLGEVFILALAVARRTHETMLYDYDFGACQERNGKEAPKMEEPGKG